MQKKLSLFFCIPSRAIISALPAMLPIRVLPYYGAVISIISITFLYFYFTNTRMHAPEGRNITWWHKYRLLHGMNYATAAIYLFSKNREAVIPLVVDVLCGIAIFMHKYFYH